MSDLPAEIKVWFSRYPIDYMGTWATTRYPAEAVTYVPKADAEAAVALALEQACEVLDTAGDSAVTEALGQKLCCSGHHCGCQGADVGSFLQHLIRDLAPPAGVAKLAELRAERDEAVSTLAYCEKQWTDTDRITHAKMLDERARADTLAAENARLRDRERVLVGPDGQDAAFDRADWFWRTMDPDDCGDSPEEAINRAMVGRFCVCEIASSYSGPTRYGFIAPVLDPESDEEEFVHFATQQEAIDAAKARAALATDADAALSVAQPAGMAGKGGEDA